MGIKIDVTSWQFSRGDMLHGAGCTNDQFTNWTSVRGRPKKGEKLADPRDITGPALEFPTNPVRGGRRLYRGIDGVEIAVLRNLVVGLGIRPMSTYFARVAVGNRLWNLTDSDGRVDIDDPRFESDPNLVLATTGYSYDTPAVDEAELVGFGQPPVDHDLDDELKYRHMVRRFADHGDMLASLSSSVIVIPCDAIIRKTLTRLGELLYETPSPDEQAEDKNGKKSRAARAQKNDSHMARAPKRKPRAPRGAGLGGPRK